MLEYSVRSFFVKWNLWFEASARHEMKSPSQLPLLAGMSRAITGLMTASYSVAEPTGQLSIIKSAGHGQSLLSYSGDTP